MANATENGAAQFTRLLEVVRELRRQCPWDREQTIASLGKHVIEEAYEALDAINRADARAIADELGDLLSQVLFAGVIAEEEGRFRLAAMIEWATDKLVRRHPHVYGQVDAKTAGQVVANWNRIKHDERKRAGAVSALDGIANALPALMRAEKLGARAAGRDGLG